jgi:hypothetical protein
MYGKNFWCRVFCIVIKAILLFHVKKLRIILAPTASLEDKQKYNYTIEKTILLNLS